jgi:hypothetical protein
MLSASGAPRNTVHAVSPYNFTLEVFVYKNNVGRGAVFATLRSLVDRLSDR